MNSLVDTEVIEALYEASTAGVKIDLIIRGICCLKPGVAGLSENITVRSIIGRFLEHSRIFYFENGGTPKLFLGSADWMQRNFFRRVEIVFPVEEPALRDRIVNTILATQLADNTKASILGSDGSYSRPTVKKEASQRNSQAEFMAMALGEAKSRRSTRGAKRKYHKIEIAQAPR
jgi:polyphosphate kinase